ncbi:MAG: SiaB family protein kinase [Bacteroidota bacterium]
MGKQKIILEYTGHLTFSTVGRLLTMLKMKMKNDGLHLGAYKKILSIMIEVLENIYKYSDQYHDNQYIVQNYIPEFSIIQNEKSYYIQSFNPVRNIDIPELKSRLDVVNSKNPDELKLFYRERICDGIFSSKGGAGLGLIEIAKISGKPLKYQFEKINKDFSSFSLEVQFCLE